jgi:hypothetical protein
MSKRFIHLTSGWIPVSMLCLLAVALVEGQARANLPATVIAPAQVADATDRSPAEPDLLRLWVDTHLSVPKEIRVTIDAALSAPARTWSLKTNRDKGVNHE